MAKVFITKYALMEGIREVEADVQQSNYNDEEAGKEYIRIKGEYGFYYIGRDCFIDKELAIAKAEKMRKNKIISLRKQIKKLESIKFR